MTNPEIVKRKLIDYIERMPSLPTSVSKILEICHDPRTSPADLNRVIGLDPVLMGKVLKLINSAYYGLQQEITSLVRAIIMLGINTVKNLALSTAVLGTLGGKDNFDALNMDGFWRHSLGVAVTSKMIARKLKVDPKLHEEFFIAGLLHDIGKIPLNNVLSEQYFSALGDSDLSRRSLHISEKAIIGFDHNEVGAMIIQAWQLGDAIKDTVYYHHRLQEYEGRHGRIVEAVTLANQFINLAEIGFSGNRYPASQKTTNGNSLPVTLDHLDALEDEVLKEIQKASVFLKL